jgi:folate-binding protein YgfZ
MKKIVFQKNKILPAKKIIFSITSLEKWALVRISGKDRKKYLQSQITADIFLLKSKNYFLCGHCNEQGKVYGTLLIFKRFNEYFYILRKSILNKQIKAIKKYSVFSDVKFQQEKKLFFFGIIGKKSRYFLNKFFKILPDKKNSIINYDSITVIFMKKIVERFILISSYEILSKFLEKIKDFSKFNCSDQWLLIDIEENIPIIDSQNLLNFFPQEINLQKFKYGISFNKGCYIGQEQISKIKYSSINKRSLQFIYCLHSKNIFSPGDYVYVKIKNTWIKKGILLSCVNLNKNLIYAQIVLNKFYKQEKIYRIRDSYFYIKN